MKNKQHLLVLQVLADLKDGDEFYFANFDWLAKETGLDRKVTRRITRCLARKGLTAYRRGLWTYDGDPAGSGYGATSLGAAVVALLETPEYGSQS